MAEPPGTKKAIKKTGVRILKTVRIAASMEFGVATLEKIDHPANGVSTINTQQLGS
jgi:hypothetical protein